jgi:hypothetical protein
MPVMTKSPTVLGRTTGPTFVVGQRTVMLGQGLYYLVTGLWPLVSMSTFLAVTGQKTDLWLVQTVGALIAVMGAVLLLAARRPHAPTEVVALAVGAALALTAVDVIFVVQGRIAPVYLLDAAAELALVAGWILALRTSPTPALDRLPH